MFRRYQFFRPDRVMKVPKGKKFIAEKKRTSQYSPTTRNMLLCFNAHDIQHQLSHVEQYCMTESMYHRPYNPTWQCQVQGQHVNKMPTENTKVRTDPG